MLSGETPCLDDQSVQARGQRKEQKLPRVSREPLLVWNLWVAIEINMLKFNMIQTHHWHTVVPCHSALLNDVWRQNTMLNSVTALNGPLTTQRMALILAITVNLMS